MKMSFRFIFLLISVMKAHSADQALCPSQELQLNSIPQLFSIAQQSINDINLVQKCSDQNFSKQCSLFPEEVVLSIGSNKENLPKWWAQKQIGIDLLHQEYKQSATNPPRIAQVDMGIRENELNKLPPHRKGPQAITNSFEHSHGQGPMKTIFGPNQGSSINGKLVSFASLMFSEFVRKEYTSDHASEHFSDIINISAPVRNSVGATEKVKELAKSRLIVLSSGNDYPLPSQNDFLENEAILVGSTDINGKVSSYSQVSKFVSILAPAGKSSYAENVDGDGEEMFPGTSFATPLVTGSLANVIGILKAFDEHRRITVNEIKILLEKTSTPVAGSQCNNKVGLLNSYKLFRVAERLKSAWPENRIEINNSAIYDFDKESTELINEGMNLLDVKKLSCEDMAIAFDKLRKALLLSPQNKKARQLLSNILRQNNYPTFSDFYSFVEDTENCREKRALLAN